LRSRASQRYLGYLVLTDEGEDGAAVVLPPGSAQVV
jgi:hypothetical protein